MATQLNIPYYDALKINDVFKSQNWPIDELNNSSLYNRFLRTYDNLNGNEKELFLKLSSMYKWVTLSEYQKLVVCLMEKTVKKHYGKAQDVWVYPIKKAEHLENIKSADFVSYLCNAVQLQHSDILYKKKFHVLGSMELVRGKKNKFEERPLLIIDDYIGSGKYVSEVVDELNKCGVPTNSIVICTLFISEKGLKKVFDSGVNIEYIESIKSVVSQLSPAERAVLKQIEDTLGVDETFHFGFGKAANLITLIRTPNNSLPMFWFDNGRAHNAPFPR